MLVRKATCSWSSLRTRYSYVTGFSPCIAFLQMCCTWLYGMYSAPAMVLYAAYMRASGVGRAHRNRSSSTASRSSV